MHFIEIGSLLLKADTERRFPPSTPCRISSGAGWHELLAEEETLFSSSFVPRGRRTWVGSLVDALGYTTGAHGFETRGEVVACTETECTIRFDIRVSPQFVEDGGRSQAHVFVARILSNLTAVGSTRQREPVHVHPQKQLHSGRIPELLPLLNTVEESLDAIVHEASGPKSWIENLPTVALSKIFDFCDPPSFRALQCCCRLLYAVGKECSPAIKTELRGHQRNSLKWMSWREQAGHKMPHPFKQLIQTEWGSVEADEVTGRLSVTDRDETELNDTRGGILADEPGLGKTATILSLVMQTRGLFPQPPEGSVATLMIGDEGQQIGWYKQTDPLSHASDSKPSLRTREKDPVTGKIIVSPKSSKAAAEFEAAMPAPKRQRSNSYVCDEDCVMEDADTLTPLPTGLGTDEADVVQQNDEKIEAAQCYNCYAWKHLLTGFSPAAAEKCNRCYQQRPMPGGCQMSSDPSIGTPVLKQSSLSRQDPLPVSLNALEFFWRELCSYVDEFDEIPAAVWCLFQQSPSELRNGFFVQKTYHRCAYYHRLYHRVGLAPMCNESFSKWWVKRDGEMQRAAQRVVQQNINAVRIAVLLQTTYQSQWPTFLSAATLIVVPPSLVEQWRQEITKHFRGGHLRVCTITKKSDYPEHVFSLAWCFDVVLTTFSHMSSCVSDQLLNVHWLRVVLDEGHLIGANLANTNRKERIANLKAERRWIITGTPTPDLAHRSTVSHLYPLIQFLRVEPFANCRAAWEAAIQKPFEAGLPEGQRRLMGLLNTLMIRTPKDEIRDLVRINKAVTTLEFEPQHVASYNELVEVVQRNLILADFGEEGHTESLLNPANTKWASEMLRNINISCCVAGTCYLSINEQQLEDTLVKLAIRNGHSPELMEGQAFWLPVDHPLREVEEGLRLGGRCCACCDSIRLPIVTPCAHLLCESCLRRDRTKCLVCREPYLMQSADDAERRLHNSQPKEPVPIEVIEWQPSYTQAGAVGKSGGLWQPNWKGTQSSKCRQLAVRLKEVGVMDPDLTKRTKAIVFSRFWPHIKLIDKSLCDAGIAHCVLKRDVRLRERNAVIDGFQTNPDIGVMVMDSTGAVGLDLSMASWVFLMEPLLDQSVEKQIVSRAHRMGAKQAIHVEVMIMGGSVEDISMKRFISLEGENSTSLGEVHEENGSIRNALISGLKRIKTSSA